MRLEENIQRAVRKDLIEQLLLQLGVLIELEGSDGVNFAFGELSEEDVGAGRVGLEGGDEGGTEGEVRGVAAVKGEDVVCRG